MVRSSQRRWFVASLGLAFALGIGLTSGRGRSAPSTKAASDRLINYTERLEQTVQGRSAKSSFDMIAIDGGDFLMGSPADEPGRHRNEGPQVPVRVRPFWIGKCEVTWNEFDLYYRSVNPDYTDLETGKPLTHEQLTELRKKSPADAVTRPTLPYVDETYGHERDHHPALCMTHHLAMLYCEWLSAKTGKAYRLPTEAEWEYACRAGTTTAHSIPDGERLRDVAWYIDNSPTNEHEKGTTHAVGRKKPNAWGVHDMHGNVMEWCLDHFVDDAFERYAKQLGTGKFLVRPMFEPTVNKWRHVARGGHFKSSAIELRCAARLGSEPRWQRYDAQVPQSIYWLTMMDTIGFRVCRSYEDDPLNKLRSRLPKDNDGTFKP